jgi:hypothetical protein
VSARGVIILRVRPSCGFPGIARLYCTYLQLLRRSHATHGDTVVGQRRLRPAGRPVHHVLGRFGLDRAHLEGVCHGDMRAAAAAAGRRGEG